MRHKWLYALLAVLVVGALATLAQGRFGAWEWFSLQGDDTYTQATWEAWRASEEPPGRGAEYAFGRPGFPRRVNYWTSTWNRTDDAFNTWYDSSPGLLSGAGTDDQ
jgi:hypothetical protein